MSDAKVEVSRNNNSSTELVDIMREINRLLKENNAILKENNDILRKDHVVISEMGENVRKIKYNTS